MHVVAPACCNTNTPAVKPVVNPLAAGERKLQSSTLSTFNRKVQSLLAGEGLVVEVEEAEMPPGSFDFAVDMDADGRFREPWFNVLQLVGGFKSFCGPEPSQTLQICCYREP